MVSMYAFFVNELILIILTFITNVSPVLSPMSTMHSGSITELPLCSNVTSWYVTSNFSATLLFIHSNDSPLWYYLFYVSNFSIVLNFNDEIWYVDMFWMFAWSALIQYTYWVLPCQIFSINLECQLCFQRVILAYIRF